MGHMSVAWLFWLWMLLHWIKLQLGNFDVVRPELERTLQAKRDYKKNVHQLDQELVASINHHWREYFEDYGYTMQPVETADQKA